MSGPDRRSPCAPVIPCDDFDVEVVSDVFEDLDDIEVVAQAEEDPDPDIGVAAVVEEEAAREKDASTGDQEPDWDVDVACEVQDSEEPDLVLNLSVAGDSNDPASPETNG